MEEGSSFLQVAPGPLCLIQHERHFVALFQGVLQGLPWVHPKYNAMLPSESSRRSIPASLVATVPLGAKITTNPRSDLQSYSLCSLMLGACSKAWQETQVARTLLHNSQYQ